MLDFLASTAAILLRTDARQLTPYVGADAVITPGTDYSADGIYNDAANLTELQFIRACDSVMHEQAG